MVTTTRVGGGYFHNVLGRVATLAPPRNRSGPVVAAGYENRWPRGLFINGRESSQFDQTSALTWGKEQTSATDIGGALWRVIKRAHPEAFIRAFPAGAGWLTGARGSRTSYWAGIEQAAGRREKVLPVQALESVLETGGPLVLDGIKYRDLFNLRQNQDFQDSMGALDYFMRVREHIKLIYRVLGANKRSSRVKAEGSNVLIRGRDYFDQVNFLKDVGTAIALAFPVAGVLASDSPGAREACAAAAAGVLVVSNLYRWSSQSASGVK